MEIEHLNPDVVYEPPWKFTQAVKVRNAGTLLFLSGIVAFDQDGNIARGDIVIGQLLRRHANQLNGEELLAAVILSSGLGVTVFLLFGVIRDRAVGRWHEATSGGS